MRSKYTFLAYSLCALLLGACGTWHYEFARNPDGSKSRRASRVAVYANVASDTFGAGQDVPSLYLEALRKPAPQRDIRIFNAALPDGAHLNDGVLSVDADAGLMVIGRFEIVYYDTYRAAPIDAEIRQDLQRLAEVTDATIAIIEVVHTPGTFACVKGFVLRKTGDAAPAQSVTELSGATDTSSGVPRAMASLSYAPAPSGCLSADEFADEVSAKLGYVPWTKNGDHRLAVAFAKTKDGYQGTVTLNDGRAKQVAGPTCKLATDALVVVTTVLIESN